ncbi:MAG: hypothetical protein ACYTHN_08835 [Planctomycetota bacterium]|jgi:DNA-binding transcriptional ArsR family regulator
MKKRKKQANNGLSTPDLFGILMNPINVALLETLGQQSDSLNRLSESLKLPKPLLSMHILPLIKSGLVAKSRKRGDESYRLKRKGVLGVLKKAQKFVNN